MYSSKELRARMDWLELQITKACLRGVDLVPLDEDLSLINMYSREIYDLSMGKNEVKLDKLGRPNILVNLPCDEKALVSYLSGGGTYFDAPSYPSGTPNRNLHPAFIVNDTPIRKLQVAKYKDVRVGGRNYHVSLFGLPPAYGTGGFTESYDGLASECERINAGTYDTDMISGNITRATFAYLGLLSVTEGFHCRGADYYCHSAQKTDEYGEPCGYRYNGQFVHVLTGSGPDAWRHDGTPFGIWGLKGPALEILHGQITDGGVILTIDNNDSIGMTAAELNTVTSDKYKATLMDGTRVPRMSKDESGAEIADEYARLCWDYIEDPGESGGKAFCLANSFEHRQTNSSVYGTISTSAITARDGVTIPALFHELLLMPLKTGTPVGPTTMRNLLNYIRVVLGGADWTYGASYGFGYFHGSNWGSTTSSPYGSGRVVSYEK